MDILPRTKGIRGNEMADHLVGGAGANNILSMDKGDIIKAILSKLQGQKKLALKAVSTTKVCSRGE